MIRKVVISFVFALSVLFVLGAAFAGAQSGAAGDSAAGARKAAGCLGCHAPDEFSTLSAADVEAAINKIATGKTAHPDLPAGLTAQDIRDIAAYMSSPN